jgi:hypothetical protein
VTQTCGHLPQLCPSHTAPLLLCHLLQTWKFCKIFNYNILDFHITGDKYWNLLSCDTHCAL